MPQTDLLSSARLRLDPGVRRSTYRHHCVIMRPAGGNQQLVLTPAQSSILTHGFDPPATVPEVMVQLLEGNRCPPLQEYYELILQAHAAGVLLPEETTPAPSLTRRWWVRLPPRATLFLARSIALIALISLIVAPRPWVVPTWNLGLLWGWLSACALLSFGEILAACALAGCGQEVRSPRLKWLRPWPHFCTDTTEAALGGPACEQVVALMRIWPLLAGTAAAIWFEPQWIAPLVAALLYVVAPTQSSAARQWFTGLLQAKNYTVTTGFLFEPRHRDFWTRFRVWSAEQVSRAGLLRIGWVLVWIGMVGLVMQWIRPGIYLSVGSGFGPQGRFHDHLEYAIHIAVAIPALAVLALCWALFRHWRMRRALTQPLSIAQTSIDTAALQAGDNPTALRSVPLFRGMADADLQVLANAMTPVEVTRKQVIFREDDPGDAFYVVMEGQFEVLKNFPPPSRRKKTIGWLNPGDGFGEIALLDHANRTTTIRASRAGRLLRLSKADFDRLVVAKMGGEHVRELLQSAAFLGRLTILGGWPFDDLLRHAQRCRSQVFPIGAQVLRSGEPNLWFYLVFDGAFEVRDRNKTLRRLHPGDYFGEISLLERSTATADVVAIEESRCLVMSRADFLAFIAHDYRIGLRIEALATQRRGERILRAR